MQNMNLENLSDEDITYLSNKVEHLKWTVLWKRGQFTGDEASFSPQQINELQSSLARKKVALELVKMADETYIDHTS